MRLDPASLAVLLLVNRLVDVGAKPLTASEFWPLYERLGDLAALPGTSASELEKLLDGDSVEAARLAQLLDGGSALAMQLSSLEDQGIRVLTPTGESYPRRLRERLGNAAPPVLFAVGPTGLLQHDGLGVVGSRDVSAEGGEVAKDAARVAARAGRSLISGAARGVDQLAMGAALEAGGNVVGVLADALTKLLRTAETRKQVLDGELCLCSPFKPDAGFNAGNAMARNKIIYGLSRATLVVASDTDSGGTWAGATEALKKSYGAVAVWRGPGEGPGNEELERLGASPITDVASLVDIRAQEPPAARGPVQLRLAGDHG
jgi:predicted Rossmann fold nucleotide-binding protein DprA/Smf involved in DNA uptake